MDVVMKDSSSNYTEVMFALPTSGVTRGARIVAHTGFPTCLNISVCLLMSGVGRTELGESIFTRSSIFTASGIESVLMLTSTLVPRNVLEKPLTMVSPALLDATVGI